jgi:preprotein translocase SecE subunit
VVERCNSLDAFKSPYYYGFIEGPKGFFIYQADSVMNALTTYLKNVRQEFTHIVWPTNRTAIAHTLVVVLIAIAIAVLVGISDYIFGAIVSHVVGG